MFIPDPDFYPSWIPDPTTAIKEEVEHFFSPSIFCCHKYHKIVNNFFSTGKEKICFAKTVRIVVLITQCVDQPCILS